MIHIRRACFVCYLSLRAYKPVGLFVHGLVKCKRSTSSSATWEGGRLKPKSNIAVYFHSGGHWLADSWWRHQMEKNPRYWPFVRGGFLSQRTVTRGFDVFFDLRLNKRLYKQSRRLWFETRSRSIWRHCNDYMEHWSETYHCACVK